ncbi:hypothetical protein VC83_08196 [Pseudogymnoascus destructans]|uniref:Uncharacterized protein n=2 Tax=Pseudogymnoascus destructans TaxID=655981 RepID=L8FYK7_PSED2|nr:uncharacterized protein VC83_08196 [Pseudogymnoascus destructans]ELR05957.1 hypothetical protein GMDG_01919 [Pseudogymnoascus destructans 20631-21]OAF55214.1 hypothetical protein VC83_08196 [Pseudogymnoascus destructans]
MLTHGTPGSIALIASMSETIANRGLPCAAYNASKAGVQQLGRSLAAELGKEGIRVNTISPGYVVTQMVEELFEKIPERRDGWAGKNMLGRLGKPGDLGGEGGVSYGELQWVDDRREFEDRWGAYCLVGGWILEPSWRYFEEDFVVNCVDFTC